ncbi:uncharacterized protein LOC121367978 [Gigantopelta aegis]|uniref:uncharacterized protein LOC121367978 n=1 Tax=Gigantopelta aegis TaxID=1735272 RepID=UPI001B88A224|nr:uncharacterized protein LOC121367978 [Gigantopelta aegis]
MMGHKREKRGKLDIGETYATYWIRKHQAEMCRYQPIVRENSMVTLRTKQIPERGFIREGSLMNLKSNPQKNNEFNFARDFSLSGEPTFFRDRESAFFRDPSNYYDKHASCNSSEIVMDGNSYAGGTSSHAGSAFLPEKSRRLFERWDNHQESVIPQRKYTILPQIGNPRFISIQDSRHRFVNQLDYSRDNFEKDADFFADYNKALINEEVLSVRGVPLPPLNTARLKLNIMYQTEGDISEETSQCYTNSMTLSDNLATSTLDELSDENSTITSANGERVRSEAEENVSSTKHKEKNTNGGTETSEEDSSYDTEGENIVCEKEPKKKECEKDNDNRTDEEQVKMVKCKETPADINVVESDKEKKEKTSYTKKAANIASQKATNLKLFKNLRKFTR